MQSIINLFSDSDNLLIKNNYINENNENSENSENKINDQLLSISLNQGNKFNDYQNKIYSNLETKDNILLKENFDNINSNGNDTSTNLTKKSYDLLNKTNINEQNKNIIKDLQIQYDKLLIEYQSLLNKLDKSSNDYLNRIDSKNIYLNKNIKFSTGELAYVTNRGVVKLLPKSMNAEEEIFFNNSSGCPPISQFISLTIPWRKEYNIPGTKIPTKPILISGTPKTFTQSCGNEGKNVYVNQISYDNTSKYLGCYADNPSARTMTFIGGQPTEIANLTNGNFSQPSITNNTYQYINSSSKVPGWNIFNAYLSNNSFAWALKKPYPHGDQYVVLKNTNHISQLINLPIGKYNLTFSAIGRRFSNEDKGNPVKIQIDYSSSKKEIATFAPQFNDWTNYSFEFTIDETPNNSLTFIGTWTMGERATAIQNIKISNINSFIGGGNYTYDKCKQSAIDSGYRYFGLQSVNPTTGKGYCAVSNDYIGSTSKGTSYVIDKAIPLWSSNTKNNGMSAILSNSGSLTILNSVGASIFQTPVMPSDKKYSGPPNYIGCYMDTWYRVLPHYVSTSATFEECFEQAKVKNKKYFALQYATQPTKGHCFLGDDLKAATKLGLARNCENRKGIQYGMGWSNAIYSVEPNVDYYLILENNGNMCIYRGSNPNDNQGLVWSSNTEGKKQKPDPKFAAANGKYGKNWVGVGATLSKGDFIGSNDGSTYLIMQYDGNLVLNTSSTAINCKTLSDGIMGGGINANALNQLNQVGNPSLIGNVGYIDDNSVLYNYSQNNYALSNEYTEMKGFDSPENNLSSASFGNATLNGCKTACNNNKSCYGFVYDNETKVCDLKNGSMYPKGPKTPAPFKDLYIRKPALKNMPVGISDKISNVDSIKYENYRKSNKQVNNNIGLGFKNATTLERQQVESLKSRLDLISNKIIELGGTIHNNELEVRKQSIINTNSLVNNMNDMKNNMTNINNFNTSMDNILKDSDITLLYENYNYLFWSILAAGSVIISINVANKS